MKKVWSENLGFVVRGRLGPSVLCSSVEGAGDYRRDDNDFSDDSSTEGTDF